MEEMMQQEYQQELRSNTQEIQNIVNEHDDHRLAAKQEEWNSAWKHMNKIQTKQVKLKKMH